MDPVEYEVELADSEPRPLKRPRQRKDGDDGHRPYNPQSGPSGPQVDADDGGEGGTRKGRKRPLSCGECRRLKLKCDRVFPCQSCRKRGCAEICPEGALTGGKGSRFILANTEQLHDKIKVMSERIQQLEDGLRSTHLRTMDPSEHPLLRQELLLIKKSPELFGIDQQVMVHEATPDSQHKNDEPPRTSPEGSYKDAEEYNASSHPSAEPHRHPGFSDELSRLCRAFPSPWSISFELDLDTRQRIRDMLPHRQEAQRLCEQARRNAFWQHNPDASETFLPNLVHSVYTTPLPALLPHRLGLFLMILAIGAMVDTQRGPDRASAEQYHSLSRIAMCEVPVMDDTSLDAVNALFFMEWYLLTFSDHKKALEYAWGIMGLATKLAQTISLHRDGVRSKLIPEESDKRRTLFWDLMGADVRLALLLRRPPSISPRHVDAKQPTYNEDTAETAYHSWHYGFLTQCMTPVLDVVTSTQPVVYSDVLGLDKKIRQFAIPPVLQMLDREGYTASDMMRQAMTTCTREVALLHLHRNYFTLSLTSGQEFTVKHKYAPSVLAIYSSARTLIWAVDLLYSWEPTLSSCFMVFWSNCFSAACALCFLVSRAPSLPIVPYALQDLDKVSVLFKRLSEQCPRVSSYVSVLDKFIARGRECYVDWRGGVHTPYDEMTDELCLLVRRIAPAVNDLRSAADAELTDPFEFTHSHLRRTLEQATAADPCTPSGFHLTRIRGPVGSILHPQSDVRSYSGPAESSARSSLCSPWSNGNRLPSSASALGADIADSSWMSWL